MENARLLYQAPLSRWRMCLLPGIAVSHIHEVVFDYCGTAGVNAAFKRRM
jgi:hypothetical protein